MVTGWIKLGRGIIPELYLGAIYACQQDELINEYFNATHVRPSLRSAGIEAREISLTLLTLTLADLCGETGLDSRDGAS